MHTHIHTPLTIHDKQRHSALVDNVKENPTSYRLSWDVTAYPFERRKHQLKFQMSSSSSVSNFSARDGNVVATQLTYLSNLFPRLFPLWLLQCFFRSSKLTQTFAFLRRDIQPYINHLPIKNTQNNLSTSKHELFTIHTRHFFFKRGFNPSLLFVATLWHFLIADN